MSARSRLSVLLLFAAAASIFAHTQAATAERKMALATIKTIYVSSHTHYVKQAELEKALLKHKEFDEWGLELTREEHKADVVLEVNRAAFQNNFPFSVIDRRTKVVLAAGEVNSLGGTAY